MNARWETPEQPGAPDRRMSSTATQGVPVEVFAIARRHADVVERLEREIARLRLLLEVLAGKSE